MAEWLVLRGEGASGSLAVWRHARSLKLVVTALPDSGEEGQPSEKLQQHRQVLREDPARDWDDEDEGSQAAGPYCQQEQGSPERNQATFSTG